MLGGMAFIGRERELAALGGALQRASDGEPTRVSVSGPLGIGISRLLDELSERLGKTTASRSSARGATRRCPAFPTAPCGLP